MIDLKKTYRTRNGDGVKLYDIVNDGKTVIGAVDFQGRWEPDAWLSTNGVRARAPLGVSRNDLVEVRSLHRRTVWINVFPTSNTIHVTEAAALDHRAHANLSFYPCLATVKVELDFEEGDGL